SRTGSSLLLISVETRITCSLVFFMARNIPARMSACMTMARQATITKNATQFSIEVSGPVPGRAAAHFRRLSPRHSVLGLGLAIGSLAGLDRVVDRVAPGIHGVAAALHQVVGAFAQFARLALRVVFAFVRAAHQ